MSSNVWKKRRMKGKGFVNQAVSVLTLKYTRLNRTQLKKKLSALSVDKLHVGCGDIVLKDWLNVKLDKLEIYGRLYQREGAWVINYNLLKPWPLANESV